jgi:D-alanine-D-alanine ligase-like ATP-grasp enzyme
MPMLLEGRDTRIRWAAIPYLKPRLQEHGDLHRLLEHLEALDSIQLEVTTETLAAAGVGLHQAMQDSIRRFRDRAAGWSTDAVLTTNWSATDYIDIHAAMFAKKGGAADDRKYAVGECLSAIAKGSDDRARRLWPEVLKQADKGLASVSDIRKRIGRRKPIEGKGRDYLVDNLKATAGFIEDFFALLDRQKDSKRNSLPPKHEQFLQTLYRDLQTAKNYVKALDLNDGPQAVQKVMALKALEQALRLMDQTAVPTTVADEDQLLLLEHPMGHDLQPSLEWEAPDDTTMRVFVSEPAALIESLDRAEGDLRGTDKFAAVDIHRLLVSAATEHRRAVRLLPARLIEQRLARSGKAPTSMSTDNDAAQRESRTRLNSDLQDAKQRVTNAMSLNALLQTDASRMLKLIESLSRANSAQEIGVPSKTTSLYADYPQARAVLQQLVLKPLDQRIQHSRQQIELDIQELLHDREQRNVDPIELRALRQKASRIRDRLQQGTALSVRVARNEFLLLKDDKLPLFKFDDKTAAQKFEDFRIDVQKMTNGHRVLHGLHAILNGTLQPRADGPDLLSALSSEDRQEAATFIDDWLRLFTARPRENINQPLLAFFRAAGVPQEPTMVNPTERKFFFPDKSFAGLSSSLGGVFIPPALGSDATHIDGVVVHTSATFVQLQQAVAQVRPTTPTFVLSHQSLTAQQRAQLGHDHPVLVIDDQLVAYLAINPATRLAKLLEVCLLSCRTNPYADYGARPVPPEMFFGRKDELQKLREVPSAAVLYGGRRLGKSSLLNQILEESKANVHLIQGSAGTGEMAVYVPLDSKSDPAGFSLDYQLFSWKAIYKALVSANFVKPSKGNLGSVGEIREHLQSEIVAGRVATNACYLLIDEADEVMREDLQRDTPFLTSLQNLSDTVMGKARVRYVIAGLHNLSRMTTAGNTALGKATSIALQPFSSATDIQNGVDLITKPLGALGFHFGKDDESLPMRIMAVCNFYPAFIQVYCRNLISSLYNKRSSRGLPTTITSADLDAVERDQEFLREIQEKFGLNLNLDKRYKAIALILAEHSYAEPTGGFTGLTATEIRDHCVAYAPEHFKSTGPGAYEALLDEMEKLTILERNRSRYQLRTPDIATMLGDKDHVAHLLEELAREKPTDERSRGEARLQVRHARQTLTLPMPSAWLRNYLHGDKGDLVVVVGNNLSGIGAFEHLKGSWDIGQEEATIEGISFKGPEDARTWANRERRKGAGPKTRVVAVQARSWVPLQLDGYTSVAQACGKQAGQLDLVSRSMTTTIRPLLVANPEQAFQLAQRIETTALPRSVVVTPALAWSDDAVYFWLNDLENQYVRDNGPARAALIEATCGFGDELERLCKTTPTVEEAMKQPDETRKRLAANLDSFYDKLGLPASLKPGDRRKLEDLLEMIHGEPRSTETEDVFLSELAVPRSHFVFAQWMSMIQPGADGTWRVPMLYLQLIKARERVAA